MNEIKTIGYSAIGSLMAVVLLRMEIREALLLMLIVVLIAWNWEHLNRLASSVRSRLSIARGNVENCLTKLRTEVAEWISPQPNTVLVVVLFANNCPKWDENKTNFLENQFSRRLRRKSWASPLCEIPTRFFVLTNDFVCCPREIPQATK